MPAIKKVEKKKSYKKADGASKAALPSGRVRKKLSLEKFTPSETKPEEHRLGSTLPLVLGGRKSPPTNT